jgi:hypothetical protein
MPRTRYAPQEVPLGYAPQEVPLGYAPQEVPLGYAPQEVPLGYAPQEVPLGYAPQEVPLGQRRSRSDPLRRHHFMTYCPAPVKEMVVQPICSRHIYLAPLRIISLYKNILEISTCFNKHYGAK